MNKKINHCAFIFFLLIFSGRSFGQLSEGGTPPGFKFAPSNHLPVVNMPAINIDALLAEDAINEQSNSKPYRFGYNHLVYFKPDNSGTWTELGNGDRIWQLDVRAGGAYSVNLAFSNFQLPAGAKLFVYSKDHKQVLGGFTAKNTTPDKFFGTELIDGDEVVVEYFEPAAVKGQGNFNLFRVTQGYKDIKGYLKSFGEAGSCINNVNCPQYADYATQKRSVVCLVTGGSEFCSGALVNNTLNDGTPYILTANHCGTADGTWVFRFNWEAPGCPNPPTNPSRAQSISGGVPIASSGVSDFNLVKMSSVPPPSYHVFYAGWSHSLQAATSVTGIHHPSGDIKKCSKANNAVTETFYDAGNGTALVWQIGQWTDGVTEAGSSGSPLFDQNKRIVGQLYGGPSDCGASPSNRHDYYGRFCVSWDSGITPQTRLKDWLDPQNTNLLTNDGYDPGTIQDSINIALAGIVSPAGSTCGNLIYPSITVANFGSNALNSLTITYHIDGHSSNIYHWSGLLLSLESATIDLPSLSVIPGNHTFYASISQPNNQLNQNITNDSANQTFIINNISASNLPLTEGFEGATFPPVLWSITTPPSGTTWQQSNSGGFGSSSHGAMVDEFSPTSSTKGEKADLITVPLDMAMITSPAWLHFDVAYAGYDALSFDSLAVMASYDCGATWIQLYAKGGPSLATAPNTTSLFAPTAAQWRTDSINLNSLIGQPSVQFAFELRSGYGNAAYIDNVNISGTPPLQLDAGLNSLTVPTTVICDSQFVTSFSLLNEGADTLKNAVIHYSYDGGTSTTQSWTGVLSHGQSALVQLPQVTLTPNDHTVLIFVSSPNAGVDLNHANDTLFQQFLISQMPTGSIINHPSVCDADTLTTPNTQSTYLWSNDEYTTQILAGVSGYYSVTITNSGQCTTTAYIYINKPNTTMVTLTLPTDSVCSRGETITLSGGAPPGGHYTINGSALTTFTVPNSGAGSYPVYYNYTDSNGCSLNTYQTLRVYTCTGIDETGGVTSAEVFPNPFTENFNLQFSADVPQNVDAEVYGMDGKKVITVLNNEKVDPGMHQLEINTNQLSNGIYILKVNERFFKLEKLK